MGWCIRHMGTGEAIFSGFFSMARRASPSLTFALCCAWLALLVGKNDGRG